MILPQDDKTPAEAILTNGQLRCNGAFVRANGIWVMPAVHEYQIVYCAFDTQAGLELDVYATSTPIPGGPFGTFHLMSLGANSGLNTTAEALTEKSVQKVTLGLSSLLMQSPAELSNREAGSQSLATQSGDRSLPPQSGTDRPSSLNPNNGGQELWNGFRAGMSRADASSWVGKLAVSNPEYRINIDERNTFKVTGVKVLNKNVTAVLFFGKNDSLKAVSLLTGLPEDTVISHLSAKYGQPTRCSQAAGNVGGGTVCDWVVGALLIRYNWDGGYSQINYSSSTEDSGL